jgi:hypothetical protein
LESEEDGWTLTVSVNGERDLGGEWTTNGNQQFPSI